MKPRWITEHIAKTLDGEPLLVVNVFAEGENKETVKRESKVFTHERKLVLVEGGRELEQENKKCKECGIEIHPNNSFGMCESCCETHFEKLG